MTREIRSCIVTSPRFARHNVCNFHQNSANYCGVISCAKIHALFIIMLDTNNAKLNRLVPHCYRFVTNLSFRWQSWC